jgi:soluble lytic murein transglycosylase-like protein
MDHLYFGPRARRRARRKARIKRVAIYVWSLTFAATALGFAAPNPSVGLDLISRILGNERSVSTSSAGIETSESAASAARFRRQIFAERPSPSTSPTTYVAGTSGSLVEIIRAAASEFGVSGDWMVAIATCESTLNPSAYNPAGYHGLFQYDQTTWAGYGYGSIYDPVAQSRTTARLLAAGQSSRWPNCA